MISMFTTSRDRDAGDDVRISGFSLGSPAVRIDL